MNSKFTAKAIVVAVVAVVASLLVGTPAANATVYRTPVTADTAPQGFVEVSNSLPVATTVLLVAPGMQHPFKIVDLAAGASKLVYAGVARVKFYVLVDEELFDKGVAMNVLRRVDPDGRHFR